MLMMAARLFILLLVLAGGVYAALLLFVNFYDWKGAIAENSAAVLGQPIIVNGAVTPSLSPRRPGVIFYDVEIPAQYEGDIELGARRVTVILRDIWGVVRPRGWLKSLRLDIEARDFAVAQQKLGQLDISLFMRGSYLRADSVTLTDGEGGGFTGQAKYSGKNFTFGGDVTQYDYGLFSEDLTGKVNARIDLASYGAPHELGENLSGRVVVSAGEGTIAGNMIDLWGGDFMTALAASGEGTLTALSCAAGIFEITGGIAQSRTVLDTENVVIEGRGTIDLLRGRLDLEFHPKPKKTSALTMATPVRMRGSWHAPVVTPMASSVATKIGSLLLGASNPAALALAFSATGHSGGNPCLVLLEGENLFAPEAEKAEAAEE